MTNELQKQIDEKALSLEVLAYHEDWLLIVLDEARRATKECRAQLIDLHKQVIAGERAERTEK